MDEGAATMLVMVEVMVLEDPPWKAATKIRQDKMKVIDIA